jgi:hypothetical protein
MQRADANGNPIGQPTTLPSSFMHSSDGQPTSVIAPHIAALPHGEVAVTYRDPRDYSLVV